MSKLEDRFTIHFWGVRGSIACPGVATVRYGGNTPCVEMLVGGHRLIFDAGTGIHVLGQSLLQQLPVSGHLFFSHSHWDHIQGFPFFSPAFMEGNEFNIYGGVIPNGVTIEQRLHDQMKQPNFPVPLQVMGANLRFQTLEYTDEIQLGDVTISTGLLNHPGGAIITEWNGMAGDGEMLWVGLFAFAFCLLACLATSTRLLSRHAIVCLLVCLLVCLFDGSVLSSMITPAGHAVWNGWNGGLCCAARSCKCDLLLVVVVIHTSQQQLLLG